MSKWYYIASVLKPTAVSSAVVCNFCDPISSYLCIAKAEKLEIYKITPENLDLLSEVPLAHQIVALVKLSNNQDSDSLLILTDKPTLMHVSYTDGPKLKTELFLPRKKTKDNIDMKMVLNSRENLLICYVEKSYLTAITINEGKISETFISGIRDENISDLSFIKNTDRLVVCYTYKDKTGCVQFFDVNLSDRRISEYGERFPFDEIPRKILTTQNGGILVFFTEFMIVFENSDEDYKVVNYPFEDVLVICEVSETRWVLGNGTGKLMLLNYGKNYEVSYLGSTSIATCLCYLDNQIFYIGSRVNHPKLVRVLTEARENSFIRDVQDFISTAPIFDFRVMNDNEVGIFDLIACSGTDLSGGFQQITKGVNTKKMCELSKDLHNISGLWSIKVNSPYHTHMFLSFMQSTRVFSITSESITKMPTENLPSLNECTLLVSTLDDIIIQVTPNGIYLFSSDWEVLFSLPASSLTNTKFSHACIHTNHIAVVINPYAVILYTVSQQGIHEKWRASCEAEVSSISINKEYIVLGYWEENNLTVLDINTSLALYKENKKFSAVCRSIKFINHENEDIAAFMLIGLSDGNLVIYEIGNNIFLKKQTRQIGCKGIVLEEILTNNRQYIFAACDQPSIFYNENFAVHSTIVNLRDVSYMCSFHTEMFPKSLAIVMKNEFLIINLPELQQYSVREYVKKITIRRLVCCDDKYVVISMNPLKKYFVQLYDFDKELVDSIEFDSLEDLYTIYTTHNKVYVGLGIREANSQNSIGGKILIYIINAGRLNLVEQIRTSSFVSYITSKGNYLIVGVFKEIHFFLINGNTLELKDSNQKISYVYCIDVYEENIAVADLFKTITIYSPIENKLTLMHKNFNVLLPTALKFINAKTLVVADSQGNIIVLAATVPKSLSIIAGFNIGKPEILNVIRTIKNQTNSSIIFGTCKGRIGVIIEISDETYKILEVLQEYLANKMFSSHLYDGQTLVVDNKILNVPLFIQGDIIKNYFELSQEQQSTAALMVGTKMGKHLNSEELGNLVFNLAKYH